jgi:glucose-1-phosphate thymidylyltransferase
MVIKGVILAGGKGTRLMPLTKVTNKHLLPVGDKPMIQHCVEKLVGAGITDILIVTGGEHIGHMAEFFGSGREFDCQVTYKVQDKAGGIAEALKLAEGFVQPDERMCVILGDNIFEDRLVDAVAAYENSCPTAGAMVMLKEVPDPHRFGVAEIEVGRVSCGTWNKEHYTEIDGSLLKSILSEPGMLVRATAIEEKPDEPKSCFAVTGIYFYDYAVFDIIRSQTYSDRGELEITDVNNEYISDGRMSCALWNGWWTDAGQRESYARANELVRA